MKADMSTLIEGIDYQTAERVLLEINNGKIINIERLPNSKENVLPYIGPGLVDLQINGYKGYDFNTLPITKNKLKQ